MRHLYSAVLYLVQPILLLRMLWRSRRMPEYRRRLGERFGRIDVPTFAYPVLWVHAVSLGEVQAAAPLIETLLRTHPEHDLVVTTTTPTGSAHVQALFGDRVFHCYAPWDLPGSVARFLHRVRPRLLVLMETELWPNLLHHCGLRGCRVILANARLSPRSAGGYARLPALTGAMLASLDVVACQSDEDGQRFIELGLPPAALEVTGSIKFDITYSAQQREEARRLRKAYRSDSRPVLLAASTHPGEEQPVLETFSELRMRFEDCLLVLAPRHPQRVADVEALCRRRGWRVQRRSQGMTRGSGPDIVLVDTVGELALLQSTAGVVLVGGSLVPHGGHNPLEAAAWGIPVVCGPHMDNFAAIARQLLAAGAMIQVTPATLAAGLCGLFAASDRREAMGAAGRRVVESNRGALKRLLDLIEDRLDA